MGSMRAICSVDVEQINLADQGVKLCRSDAWNEEDQGCASSLPGITVNVNAKTRLINLSAVQWHV